MITDGRTDETEAGLRVTIAQLEHALSSRIVIEQAKGVLAERLETSVDEAFELLRRSARNARTNLHELAARVVDEPQTPGDVASTPASWPGANGAPPTSITATSVREL